MARNRGAANARQMRAVRACCSAPGKYVAGRAVMPGKARWLQALCRQLEMLAGACSEECYEGYRRVAGMGGVALRQNGVCWYR